MLWQNCDKKKKNTAPDIDSLSDVSTAVPSDAETDDNIVTDCFLIQNAYCACFYYYFVNICIFYVTETWFIENQISCALL